MPSCFFLLMTRQMGDFCTCTPDFLSRQPPGSPIINIKHFDAKLHLQSYFNTSDRFNSDEKTQFFKDCFKKKLFKDCWFLQHLVGLLHLVGNCSPNGDPKPLWREHALLIACSRIRPNNIFYFLFSLFLFTATATTFFFHLFLFGGGFCDL